MDREGTERETTEDNSSSESSKNSQGSNDNVTNRSSDFDRPSELTNGLGGPELASSPELKSKAEAPFPDEQLDDSQGQNQTPKSPPSPPTYTGSGVRTNSLSSPPNRCSKPEDFPDFTLTRQEKAGLAVNFTSISGGLAAIGETSGLAFFLTGAGIGANANQALQTLSDANDRAMKNATPEQIRCETERDQKKRDEIEFRSWGKHTF